VTYDLYLRFQRPIESRHVGDYFAGRKHYVSQDDVILYENPDTKVNFWFEFRQKRSLLRGAVISDLHFEINYSRPRFFAREAEIELSALMKEFRPTIFDPQIQGMRDGPYSPDGFLRGWNFGNTFSARRVLDPGPRERPTRWTLPERKLQAAWEWNYRRDAWRRAAGGRFFVPHIVVDVVGGRPGLSVMWALGMPILLPEVDYVVIGRDEEDRKVLGVVPFAEAADVIRAAGVETGILPIAVDYTEPPDVIAEWVASVPKTSDGAFFQAPMHMMLDDEVLGLAAEVTGVRTASIPIGNS
jgi:hypothetical protein